MPTVLKLGGAVVDDDATLQAIARAWNARNDPNETWYLVHGGGPQLDMALRAVQGPPIKVAGLRQTTEAGANAVRGTLDLVGAHLAACLRRVGAEAVHVPATRKLLQADTKDLEEGDIGRVGTPTRFKATALRKLVGKGVIAVISPVGFDADGPLNVNADEAACAVAGSLRANRLVLVTDVDAVLDGDGQPIADLTPERAKKLIASGTAKGGMIPKLQSAMLALDRGAKEVVVGRVTAAWDGTGTSIQPKPEVLA